MATLATGQPPPGVVQPPSNPSNTSPPLNLSQTNPQTQNPSYKSILHPKPITTENRSIPAPTFALHHGEPSFVWEDLDVKTMVINEDLQFAVVGKFAYGMPEFQELKKQLPLQLEIKGECCIGFLESRHVLIRLSLLEDYVHLLSRPAYYIKIGHRLHQMRGLKYEVWFDPKEETSIGVAWISFPGLPPVFFGKESVFSLARAVGRPLQLDAATKSKSRPSCAKVKVEVDLLAPRPQRLRIGIKNSLNGETRFKWIKIMYDYIPKYCSECRLQGHNEVDCYVLHPDLVPTEDAKEVAPKSVRLDDELASVQPIRILKSGKVVGNVNGDVEPTQPTQKNSDGNLVVAPVLTQGRQGKNSNKHLHPNRNPMAWTRVEKKTKQVTIDAICVNQVEPVATTNAFAMLDVNENRHELGKSAQPELDATVTQHSSKGVNDSTKGGDFLSPNSMQIGTRSWAQEVFKDHPKDVAVGVSIKSGSGKSRAVLNEMLESQKGIKDGGEMDCVVCTAEGLINAQKGIQTPGVTQPSASPSELIATDINENVEHQPSALICENVQHVNEAPAFKSQAASNVKIPSQKTCLTNKMSDGLLDGESRGEVGICSDSRVSSCGVRQICSPTLIKNGSMENIKAGRSRGEQLGSSCIEVARIHDAAFYQDVKDIKYAALESTPSRLDIEAGRVLNSGDSRGDLKIPSFLIPRHMSSFLIPRHMSNSLKDAHAFGNAETLNIHSKASPACESASRDFNIIKPFHRTACVELNKLHAHGVVQLGNSRQFVSDSRGGYFNDGDDLIKQDGAHGNHYQSARGDQKGTQIHEKDLMLHQLSPKLSGNNDDLIPLPKLKLMTAQVNAAVLMSGINAPLNTSVRRAPVAAVSTLPVIENTSQQEVPSNSMEIKITSDAAVDGNGQELPDPDDDEELLDYGEDDETDAASTENYEEDPADEYIGLRGLLSTDSSVKGDEFDNAQEAASLKNAVIEKQQGSPEKAQVGAEMPLDVGNASPGLSEGRLSEKELLRAAFYSSRSNNSQLVAKNFEPKPHLAHLVDKLPAQEVNIGEDDELDTESTAQNYVNAAANADLSPEKVAEHKKKLKKYRGRRDKSVPPTVGGRKSARISLSKTSGRQ